MTRDEMIHDIERLRTKASGSHRIGIVGSVGNWQCQFDDKIANGTTPMEAYEAAKAAAGAL